MNQEDNFSKKDLLDILVLIDTLDSKISLKDAQEDFVKKLPEVFQAESAIFLLRDLESLCLSKDNISLINLNWLYVDQYIERYNEIDPFIKRLPGLCAWRDCDLMPHAKIERLDYYHEFLKPQHIRHLMILYLQDKGNYLGHIGVIRQDQKSHCFSLKELLKAQLLAKIVTISLRENNLKKNCTDLKKLIETNELLEVSLYETAYLQPQKRQLTPREMEIAYYICQGLTNNEICEKLCVSLPTVATHIQHIFEKLEVNSRNKLTHKLLFQSIHKSSTGTI